MEVSRRLQDTYNSPDLGNVSDVFGEIVYALLSTRSATANYQRAFKRLRTRFPNWDRLADAGVEELREVIQPCGLHGRKARAIAQIAQRVFRTERRRDLEHLRSLPTREAESYLLGLPEVGPKIAKCVCLYALNRPVLPLDTHNNRVLKRLGVISRRTSRREEDTVEALVPEEIRRSIHVNLVAHGRMVCKRKPACNRCVLIDLCGYASRRRGIA
jgi:endonuclease-3